MVDFHCENLVSWLSKYEDIVWYRMFSFANRLVKEVIFN